MLLGWVPGSRSLSLPVPPWRIEVPGSRLQAPGFVRSNLDVDCLLPLPTANCSVFRVPGH
jgi:hypothetical protein